MRRNPQDAKSRIACGFKFSVSDQSLQLLCCPQPCVISEGGDDGVEVVADNVCHTSSRQGRNDVVEEAGSACHISSRPDRSAGVVEEDNVCRISSRRDRSEAGGDGGGDQPE